MSTLAQAAFSLDTHDHEQLELQVRHPASSPDRHALDLYVFVPRNVGLSEGNYTRPEFYADLTTYLRVDLEPLALAELRATHPRSPLRRVEGGLVDLESGGSRSGAVSVHVKLFGHLFAEAIVLYMRGIRRELAGLASRPERERWSFLDRLDVDLMLACDVLNDLRLLRRRFDALLGVAPSVGPTFAQTEEYSSLIFDAQLAETSQALESWAALLDGSCFVPRLRLVLARHAAEETEKRGQMGFLNLHADRGRDAEYFSYRQSLLKKAVHQALWVETRPIKRDHYIRNASGMVAAGLAATWALVAQLPLQFAKLSGSAQVAMFALPVMAYVAKDRIKELTREMLVRRFQDFDHSIGLSAVALEEAGWGGMAGQIQERMRFVDPSNVPEAVMRARLTERTVRGAEAGGESVLHYRRRLAVAKSASPASGFGLRQILRLNLRHFLTRMDEPEQHIRHYAPQMRRFVERRLPKVYHLNVVAQGLGGHDPAVRWRIVLNKRGIVRIEEVQVRLPGSWDS